MDRIELARIIEAEALSNPALTTDERHRADAVVLEEGDGQWTVYLNSERGWPIGSTVRTFDNESEALDRVLLKLRQVKTVERHFGRD